MSSWLNSLFGGKTADPPAPGPSATPGRAPAQENGAPVVDVNRSVQDVLRLSLRDTARHHGVPAEWLGCEVLSAGEGSRAQHQVHLILKVWDADFWLHADAFANAFIAEIRHFSPEVATRLRGVVWQVSPDAGCPMDTMPQADYWSEESRAARERARKKQQANSLLIDDEKVQVGFQATQPMSAFPPTQPMAFDKTMPLKRDDLPKVDFEKTIPMKAVRNP